MKAIWKALLSLLFACLLAACGGGGGGSDSQPGPGPGPGPGPEPIPGTSYQITYNYQENGGTSITKGPASAVGGTLVDLSPVAGKPGWDFVGWNIDKDATAPLLSYTMPERNLTLYAIYSKGLKATFQDYAGASMSSRMAVATMYNKATSAPVTLLAQNTYNDGSGTWTPAGWSSQTAADAAPIAGNSQNISADTTFYGLYRRGAYTLSYNANGGTPTPPSQSAGQQANSFAIAVRANPPLILAGAISKPNAAFDGWALNSATGTKYDAGASIQINANTVMFATWKDGAPPPMVSLNVSDQTASTTFKGISTTVHHCTTFMTDVRGRNYTDAMAATEMDRLKMHGITTVRSRFKSGFAWKPDFGGTRGVAIPFGGWDWDSNPLIQAFYKCAGMLQDRGIDIMLDAGWDLNEIINQGSESRETPYLWGVDTWDNAPVMDRYQESANAGFTPTGNAGEDRISRASLRYAEWIRQALEAFEAHGIRNVKYLKLFGEPCVPESSPIGAPGCAAVWVKMATALHNRLQRAPSIRGKYKLIGPNQLNVSTAFGNGYQAGLLKYVLDPANMNPDVIDIFSSHFYPGRDSQNPPVAIHEDKYGAISDGFNNQFRAAMDNSPSPANRQKDFWIDETFADGSDSKLGADSPWAGTQTAVMIASAMNKGIDGIISWQFTDQLWPDVGSPTLVNSPAGGAGSEFDDGYHVTGMAPSLLKSYLPKAQYYAVGLAARYLGGASNGTVYKSSSASEDAGLYISTVKRADGKWTVLVVNASAQASAFKVSFAPSLGVNGQTFNRHLYNPASVVPTAEAKLAGIDLHLTVTSNAFIDTIPSGGVAVYTTDAN